MVAELDSNTISPFLPFHYEKLTALVDMMPNKEQKIMSPNKNIVVLWMLCLTVLCSQGAQESKASSYEITSASIEWTKGEPQEIVGTKAYKRWLKEFGVIDGNLAKQLEYIDHNIRYAFMDVTNDGQNEIVVQEGKWAARGYAFAIFELQGKRWTTIVQHRGAFIFSNSNNKKPYELALIEKDGRDFERYDLKYAQNKYKLIKKTIPYEDMSYEYFWSLNLTKDDQCRNRLRTFTEKFITTELCRKSVAELKESHFSNCDDADKRKTSELPE